MEFLVNSKIVVNEEIEESNKMYIFYDIDEDRIFVLNESAYEIYALFISTSNKADVCASLEKKHQLNKEEMQAINVAINHLIEKKILISR